MSGPAPVTAPVMAEAVRLLHELHVHQVELEAQNAELGRLRDELAVSLAAYTDLYEHAPVAYLTVDAQGCVAQLNAAACALLGASAADLLGGRLERHFRHPQRRALLELVAQPHAVPAEDFELESTHDAGPRVVRVECRPDARTGLRRVVLIDVTRRRQLEQAVMEAVTHEQLRLGAELHDGLGQELAGLRLLLASVERVRSAQGLPEARDLQACQAAAARAIGTCKALARGLSPLATYQGGLGEALRELVERMADPDGPELLLHVSTPHELALPPSSRDHLFRIAQEALSNARRHSGAAHVRVSLAVGSAEVILEIADDGCGYAPGSTGEGLGLGLMQHRAKLISAVLAMESAPGCGTRVRCTCEQEPVARGDTGRG